MATQGVPGNGLVPSLGTHPFWSPPCKSPQILLLALDTLGALALPGTGIKTNKAHAIHAPQPAPHPTLFCPGCPRQVLRSLVLSSAQQAPAPKEARGRRNQRSCLRENWPQRTNGC